MILTGPDVQKFHLIVLKSALRLETRGLSHSSGRRASVEVRKVLERAGIKPAKNKILLLKQFERFLAEQS